jgi:ribonuclease HII
MPAPRIANVFQPPQAVPASKMARLKLLVCSDAHERRLRRQGYCRIAGVDEVGRGALFGPVVAAAVVLPEQTRRLARMGLRDSKQLTCELREELDQEIRSVALAVGIAEVDAATIDAVNIYQASRLAMLRAVEAMEACSPGVDFALDPVLDHLLIDAIKIDHPCAQTKLIYGDSLSLSIAAASVVAKVYRDALMRQLDAEYPQYGLAAHKGYGTPQHKRALLEHGPCALHRRSFAPVAAVLGGPVMDEEFALNEVLEAMD